MEKVGLVVGVFLVVGTVNCSKQTEALLEYLSKHIIQTSDFMEVLQTLEFNDFPNVPVYVSNGPSGKIVQAEYPCNTTRRDCLALLEIGCANDGIYRIDPGQNGQPVLAYCDMSSNGGGWTVIQRRVDDSVNFFRDWGEYANGFGYLDGNMWLGLDTIHKLTKHDDDTTTELYIHLESFDDETAYARFSNFYIDDNKDYYKLHVSGYEGTAGDSFLAHNNCNFSAYDLDMDANDGSCAQMFRGGWWYKSCHSTNLNGLYLGGHHESYANGVNYYTWKQHHYSVKTTVMKVRRKLE